MRDSGDGGGRASFVVIDTSTGHLIHHDSASYGGGVVVLSVHTDAIPGSPGRRSVKLTRARRAVTSSRQRSQRSAADFVTGR